MQKKETIKLKVLVRGMRNSAGLDSLIEQSLDALRRLIPISTAQVVLEQQRDTSPAYRVFAHLAVPGPDVHAVASDHTLLAAWRKLAMKLAKQFQQRTTRQQLRLKDRGLCRKLAGARNGVA
jgi:ribosome-associated translation inhibitor RaiA